MSIALAVILTVVNLLWLFLVVLGMPGNWLMVAGAIALWWYEPTTFSVWTLVAMGVLAGVGELLELVAGMAGAKKAGGTRRGAIGALVGGLIGGIVATFLISIPVAGTLIGACVGASLGAGGLELTGGRSMDDAVKSGVGAGVGRLVGTGIKLAVGVMIWVICAVAAFVP
jgi:uncharacterized protein YqgC (DUF456 family)